MRDADGPKATVLVADDEEANRLFLSELLTLQGYSVVCAENGDRALEIIQQRPVSLVLLDVMMPGRTGFAVCHELKCSAETRLIPVVLVTGLANTEDRVQGIEAGADDFLSKPVQRAELLARVRSLLRLKQFTDELENAETVLCSLALSIEAKDPYTEGHCERLSRYSVALAQRLGLPEEQRVALRRGGIVHDIGKVAVPEHILLKPAPLSAAERKVMEQHPVVGERICAPLKTFREVLPVIRYHHEKMDGSGYPDGKKKATIPLTARILQTADIYDALTTDRPYRRALPVQEAFRVMREEVRRGWWDAELVDELEAIVAGATGLPR
jgi:putative two-component system response regulator